MASTRALFNPLKTRQYALEHAFSIRSSMQNMSGAPYRALATSSTVHAKKKKTKSAQESDLFDEGNDEDDLFGGSSNSTSDKTRSPAASSQASIFHSHESGTYTSTEDQEKLRLQEIERSERFNALFDWLQKSTGPPRKGSGVQPGQTALVQLIRAAKTPNDFESVFNVLRQWRLYPAATYREVVEHTLIERAIATGNTAVLLPVLSRHPIYGISTPTPSKARALLKSIVSPPSATTEGIHHARLQQALDLAQVLAGTRVAVPVRTLQNSTQSPLTIVDQQIDSTSLRSDFVSLSPFQDFVSGSILLAALVRALTELPSSTQYSTEDCWKAVTELVSSLRSAQRDNKLLFSSIQQEQVWSLAALRQVKQDLLSNKEALVTLSETQSTSEPSISFEELVSWTDDSLGTVGAILVARGKTGAKIVASVGSHMLETRSLGTEQAECFVSTITPKKIVGMSTSILSTARSPTRNILRSVLASRRPFANTFVPHNQASRGTPAAGVPNTPSPFQLTPETLKQQNISEKITRVPLDKRGYTSQTLVAAFGRGLSGKLPDAENVTWEELFKMDKKKLDTLGLTVQDRRYLLWCLEKFRQGKDPKAFAKEPPPKKTQRGWGPAVRKKPS